MTSFSDAVQLWGSRTVRNEVYVAELFYDVSEFVQNMYDEKYRFELINKVPLAFSNQFFASIEYVNKTFGQINNKLFSLDESKQEDFNDLAQKDAVTAKCIICQTAEDYRKALAESEVVELQTSL